MDPKEFCRLASGLLSQPAVPYHEQSVRAEIEKICGAHELPIEEDQFGNVLVKLQTTRSRRALVLSAHLDHPGFEILQPLSQNSWLARFRGGVANTYFQKGTAVRLMPGGSRGGSENRDAVQRFSNFIPLALWRFPRGLPFGR